MEAPLPIEWIKKWAKTRRPDIIGYLDEIEHGDSARKSQYEAMMFLLSIGFAAGRMFQRENPHNDFAL